ncbi:fringe-like protein [Thalictrum thalictroides]|uniref:Fringe-like protein n=1 Tax=Thalictrum thalictroides TaxID=46969 RepID=A0A7J6UT45_THATH|nr:fringe-like protein [Thalictrum thalictroides]
MKGNQKDSSEKLVWDQMRSPSGNTPHVISSSSSSTRALPKLMVWLIIFISVTYVVYTLKLVSTSRYCYTEDPFDNKNHLSSLSSSSSSLDSSSSFVSNISISQNQTSIQEKTQKISEVEKVIPEKTGLQHIVFGIAASASLWEQRKNYIKLWWKPKEMRGIVWLDKSVKTQGEEEKKILPPLKISADTSQFAYKNRQGHRSAIRISRIVSETFRLGLKDVRWFVMGDDDTVFVADNLVRVLSKYDHTQYYYIGSLSESHLQNIYFSYGMAYGGGGFAISYPLAKALYKMQDKCIQRYPGLYGSDDRMQACMAELGVPLTKELGFHQYDVYGNLFGLLSAHPVTPLVTLHHLDVVEPIFPNVTRVQALQRLTVPMKLDSAGLMQQSICYDKNRIWTISVSWGFAVQIIRGVFSPREMEMPSRTFLNWYRRADYTAYAFNTRPVSRNNCQKPYVFYMSTAKKGSSSNQTVSEYVRHRVPHPACKWKMADPAVIERIQVFKKPDPHLWDKVFHLYTFVFSSSHDLSTLLLTRHLTMLTATNVDS